MKKTHYTNKAAGDEIRKDVLVSSAKVFSQLLENITTRNTVLTLTIIRFNLKLQMQVKLYTSPYLYAIKITLLKVAVFILKKMLDLLD